MTNQMIPADLSKDDVALARDWASHVLRRPLSHLPMEQSAARVLQALLPPPPRPTLADMTEDERRLARKWAAHIIRTPRTSLPIEVAAARVILHAVPAAPRPTLADMTLDEQDECAGMQADLAQGDRVVILDGTPGHDGLVQVLESSLYVYCPRPADVTPRPDLPRMTWPGDQYPDTEGDDSDD